MEIKKDLTTPSKGILQNNDSEYVRLFYVRLPKIQTSYVTIPIGQSSK